MSRDLLNHPRRDWLRKGIIKTSLQEPLAFLRRRGETAVDPHDAHFAPYTEAQVRKWKKQGVNLVIVSGQKGAGFKAERENIEASKKMARLCHKHGLRVGTYIGDTLLTETLFDEFPEARQWAQIDACGRPVLYAATQPFRQKGCRNNPGYLGFLKEATRVCVQDIGVDFLHYDNMFNRWEPYLCHCDHCRDGLRAFLRAKYTKAQLMERFGFTDVNLIETPRIWPGQEPWRWDQIGDPLTQEWIDFHCEALAAAYGELARYARSLNPDVTVECNPYGLGAANNFLRLYVDHQRLLPHGDVFWSEEHEYPQVMPDGALLTKVRSYKLAQSLGQTLFTYNLPYRDAGPAVISVCESFAFNGANVLFPRPEHGRARALFDFHAKHEDLYVDTTPLATAAVFRQFHTLAYHTTTPRYEVQMAEQALIQSHTPFGMIFDRQLETAEEFGALVLADVRCLSDEQIRLIRAMVRKGLGLVVTGQTSLCDHWLRTRGEFGLADVLGVSDPAKAAWGPVKRGAFGRGRVAYLPKLEPGGPFRAYDASLGNLYLDIHRLPLNWREFAEAVAWAAGGLPVEVEAPPTVVCEFLLQKGSGRALVHMVNYQPLKEAAGLRLRFRKDLVKGRKRARFVSPDPGAGPAGFEFTSDGLVVTVPKLEAYGIVVVE
ncbi:MAG TPA: hypothetical protein P5137_01620 [Candidatus Brocadiia bacterium]|nr:hypothetical protein [Candidatus Brocadiia bacterium]